MTAEELKQMMETNPDGLSELLNKLNNPEQKDEDVEDSEFLKGLSPEVSKYIKSLRSENKNKREKASELQKKIDELNDKQKQKEKEKLIEDGKFKELAEARELELKELQKLLDTNTAELDSLKAEKEKQRKEAIKLLPENIREVFKDASLLQINAMLDTIKANSKDHSLGTSTGQGTGVPNYDNLSWDELTRMSVENPEKYRDVIKNRKK